MEKSGIVKVIVVVALAALVGAAFLFMTLEQSARNGTQEIYDSLSSAVDDHLTNEQVHKRLERGPNQTRSPSKHRMVEEYTLQGAFESHTVYAYYTVAAAKILEAVSLDQKLEKWETE